MKYNKYSVLMSVYHKEQPEFLKRSIESVLEQTIVPNEIVIVKDGKLTDALENVLNSFSNNPVVKVVGLEKNVGLGKALSIGLEHCTNELVARMDTDDIALPNRFEKQLNEFNNNSNLSLVGTSVSEFIGEESNVVAYKNVKTTFDEIKHEMKFRNPINHPTVMFKKSAVIAAGNYQHFNLNEDYYLWIRMMLNGFEMLNINEPLTKMRITDDTYLRRGGLAYFITQKKLFDYMLKNKIITLPEYLYNNAIRFVVRVLLPNKVRKMFYLKLLRKKSN